MIKPDQADEREECTAGCALLKDVRQEVTKLETVINATYLIEDYCPLDRMDLIIQKYQIRESADALSAHYQNVN